MSTSPIHGPISNLWFSTRPILLIMALIGFSLYTNDAIIQYRMEEYNRAMESLSQSYNSSHALNMLARFDLIKKRQSLPEEDETALELKLQSLSSGKLLQQSAPEASLQSRAIELAIGMVEFVLGKRKRKAGVPPVVMHELEVAYFYERSRKYEKAIDVYTKGLDSPGVSNEISATLLLHRGFCSSLMGEYAKAIEDFRRVGSLLPGTEEARVATRLSELTLGLQDQVRLARDTRQGPLQAGKQMFLLANYSEAMRNLRKAIDNSASDGERDEGRYLYGRSQEEMGQDSDAVLTYRSLIQQAPNSAFARKANRRLYVLGKFYSNDEELTKTALKKIEQYQDFKFINSLKSLEVARPRPAKRAVPADTDDVPAFREHSSTKLEKVDPIDVADLRGDNKAKKEDSARSVKADAQKLVATLRDDGRARRSNAKIIADPLRQKAIFETLEGNQGELEFLYRKWLSKGAVFEGSLTVRMLIDPNGNVRDAKIVSEKSSIDNPAFSADILQNVKKWKFREDPGTTSDIPVSFPVRFVNKQ